MVINSNATGAFVLKIKPGMAAEYRRRVLRFHIRDRLADVEIGDPLMQRCISDIDRRVIPELEKLLAQVRSEVDQYGLPITTKRDR